MGQRPRLGRELGDSGRGAALEKCSADGSEQGAEPCCADRHPAFDFESLAPLPAIIFGRRSSAFNVLASKSKQVAKYHTMTATEKAKRKAEEQDSPLLG